MLGTFYYVIVLFLNAIAILNEERFLNRIGWTADSDNQGFGTIPGEESVSSKLFSLVKAIRTVTRPFLIAFNISIIIYELVLG